MKKFLKRLVVLPVISVLLFSVLGGCLLYWCVTGDSITDNGLPFVSELFKWSEK